jgi:hypothetical protein
MFSNLYYHHSALGAVGKHHWWRELWRDAVFQDVAQTGEARRYIPSKVAHHPPGDVALQE